MPLGPSAYLTDLAKAGLPAQLLPLPAYSSDPALADIPYHYFKLTVEGQAIYLFSSLDEAQASSTSSQKLGPGEVYVSYDDMVDSDGQIFFHLRSGYWIRGDFGGRLGKFQVFEGLIFTSTPWNGFGWILGDVDSYSAPSLSAPKTGNQYHRFNVVQVYGTQEADGLTWARLGLDEWIDDRQVGRVEPRAFPPEGVPATRWIEVNLAEQTVAIYQDDRLIYATLASTGIQNLWTRPGIFQIREKKVSENMTGGEGAPDYYHVEDVPWTMYFDQARALHGAYWHNFFGYPMSHGCVNLSLGDSHWIYDWANVGDYVYVYDPSGRTPTDPSLFGSGAP